MTPTIWERVRVALATLNVPFAADVLQGELPDVYLVYGLVSNPALLHADNREIACAYTVQVSTYSRSGLATAPNVAGAMTAAGFMRSGARPISFNPATGHYGLAQEFTLMESKL